MTEKTEERVRPRRARPAAGAARIEVVEEGACAVTAMAVRVLVIEGDGDLLRLLAEVLATEGYDVACAGDDEAMRAALRAERPDVVVLGIDAEAPAVGWRRLAALRRDPRDRALPVVVALGDDPDRDAHRALLGGRTHVLRAPYTFAALVRAAADALATPGRDGADRDADPTSSLDA